MNSRQSPSFGPLLVCMHADRLPTHDSKNINNIDRFWKIRWILDKYRRNYKWWEHTSVDRCSTPFVYDDDAAGLAVSLPSDVVQFNSTSYLSFFGWEGGKWFVLLDFYCYSLLMVWWHDKYRRCRGRRCVWWCRSIVIVIVFVVFVGQLVKWRVEQIFPNSCSPKTNETTREQFGAHMIWILSFHNDRVYIL